MRVALRLQARRAMSVVFLAGIFLAPWAARAEVIKIGQLKTAGNGATYVALDRGYFAAEGLEPQLVFFEAAQPIAVAVVSGDVDIGATALTGGLYNLAAQGALRVIAGQSADVPTFQNNTVIVSNRAYAAGLKSYKDLKDRSVAITTIGSSPQYCIVLLTAKYGIDLNSIRFLPVQTTANVVSAVSGGQADAGVGPAAPLLPAVDHGDAKLLGFVGDETPFQLGAVFISTKTADQRQDMVRRFLRAYRRGARDYHDAFTGPGEKRRDGPDAPAILAILEKHLGQSEAQVKAGISYVEAQGRIDAKDVQHQIDWYRKEGLVKGELKASDLIDKRYALTLTEK